MNLFYELIKRFTVGSLMNRCPVKQYSIIFQITSTERVHSLYDQIRVATHIAYPIRLGTESIMNGNMRISIL